ncbi:MAG TPA: permease [Burkholderiales bacterium]|nr:permease [Burkholderiales bacterium]
MHPAGLKLEQAPPIAVPFRFFLTAPVFLLAAAALLAWSGAEAFDARATPAALAATHLVTLGYMAMVMLGAMLQILPVLAGAPVPGPRLVAGASHALLVVGTAALAAGFALGAPAFTKLAAWTLGGAFVVFLAAVAAALVRAAVRSATVIGMTLAAVSLAITVALGLVLAAMHGWGVAPPSFAIRELHPAWGLAGWAGLLVAGVAYQVVPMFQMTPPYPPAMTRWFPAAVFAVLAAWSVATWYGDVPTLAATLAVFLAGGYIAFALTTLVLQTRRKRRVPDATLAFWQLGMASIALAAAVWCVRAVRPEAPGTLDLLIGCLAIGGGAVAVIAGMLYKIVPFLGWFHLQASVGPKGAPHMKKFLGDSPQQLHVRVHLVAVVFLAGAAVWPQPLAYVAAAALGASALVQFRNLALAARFYRAELARAPRPA